MAAGARLSDSLCSLWCGCIRAGAALPPRLQVSSYVTTDGRSADHKSDVEQQEDVAPPPQRSHLFRAAVETPLLDLRDKFTTLPTSPAAQAPDSLPDERERIISSQFYL